MELADGVIEAQSVTAVRRVEKLVPFELTLQMVGTVMARLKGKGLPGRANTGDKGPRERGPMLCSGDSER